MMLWRGVFVATVTPFNSKKEVDLEKYRELLTWLAQNGVHGFVPCGTTGEGSTLTQVERNKLIELSCEIGTQNKLKTIAGCGSNCTRTALAMILEAHDIGAHAALVVTPYYNKPTQEGLLAHYRHLADSSPLPIILYNVPGRTNVHLQLPTIEKLFQHENIVGIKEASGNYSQWLGIAQNTDLQKKSLLAGDDDAFVAIRELGGSGIISATANVAPKEFVTLYQLTENKEFEKASTLQKKLYSLIKSMFIETNPSPVKYALKLMNKMQDDVRLPLVSVSAGAQPEIKSALSNLGLL